jgi:glutaminyl-peptide cyclotransferase
MHKRNRLKSICGFFHVQLVFTTLILGFAAICLQVGGTPPGAPAFSGTVALAETRHAVSFGERPSGSEANQRLRAWIISELKPLGAQISLDSFTARTPTGPVPMANIIVKFPGTSGNAIAVTGHYDTKRIPMVHFIGANDAGSSTGFLIEFARLVPALRHPDDIYVVFFDGEEAVATWSATDSKYGSRHLAAQWLSDGTLSRIKALINVDMIGDKDLDISDDENSSQSLRSLVKQTAEKLGYARYFRTDPGGVDDDHEPFVEFGVNAIDIIDLNYGPNNSYWHTAQDTMDKLSAHSFQVVGDVVLHVVEDLEQRQ